jgi:hypothetical protein
MQPDSDTTLPVHGGRAVRGTEASKRAVGVGPVVNTGLMQYGKVTMLIGALESYICADCGYHESYVIEPAQLDWEHIRGLRWLNADPNNQGPYR